MQEFIESLVEGIKINILGKEYVAIGCVDYVALGRPTTVHTKVFFDDKQVLVISASSNFACFGKDLGAITENDDFAKSIFYKGDNYEFQNSDYQKVKCVRFGSPVDLEGEVEYWDYQGSDNPKLQISFAKIPRTGERSDVVAIELSEDEFYIVK
ncbi:MAG: hypothetical protein WCQ49_01290 [Candidatus Saccharibacteria bacterium]